MFFVLGESKISQKKQIILYRDRVSKISEYPIEKV